MLSKVVHDAQARLPLASLSSTADTFRFAVGPFGAAPASRSWSGGGASGSTLGSDRSTPAARSPLLVRHHRPLHRRASLADETCSEHAADGEQQQSDDKCTGEGAIRLGFERLILSFEGLVLRRQLLQRKGVG